MSDEARTDGPANGVSDSRTLWSMAVDWAGRRGCEHALVYLPAPASEEGRLTISWGELVEQVAEVRSRLAAVGVGPQAAVVLALPNSPMAIALWLAIPANGAIVQVVDPDAGSLAIDRHLAATAPVAVICGRENQRIMGEAIARAGHGTRLIVLSDLQSLHDLREQLPARAEPVEAVPEMIAGRLPTSGTSGAFKLVELTHRNYVYGAERLARNSGFRTSDRHYLCSPLFHTNGQLYLCAPAFVTGGSIAVVPRFSAGAYFDMARWSGATVASMVAPPMRMALHRAIDRGAPVDAGDLRLIQYGMMLDEADWAAWDRLVPQIEMRQIYGQTESVTGVLGGSPWEADDRRTLGRPFVGVDDVRLVTEAGDDVGMGEPGELWVKGTPGVSLMLGYHQDSEASAQTLRDGEWLRTGDIMACDRDGRFEFRGRGMHIIRRGGENVSTYVLELDLRACPLLADVAITTRRDRTLDALVIAHVIPGPGYTEPGFLAWCQENIGRLGIPDEVRVHDAFPRTGSGRVITRELE